MRTDELDFELPPELIATRPAEPRDQSRLLVVQRSDPDRLEDRMFSDLPELLSPRDLLVFNESRVVPARLLAINPDTGGRLEGLFLHDRPHPDHPGRCVWSAYIRAKRTKPGKCYALLDQHGSARAVRMRLLEMDPEEGPGAWRVMIEGSDAPTLSILAEYGRTPLPPYILAQRRARGEEIGEDFDRSHYQTTFANPNENGSVAAPTAGLHFTPEIFRDLSAVGVDHCEVTLHVGAGTFKPIEADTLEAHRMHHEWCSLGRAESRFRVGEREGGHARVIAVGSTSARTLESYARFAHNHPGAPFPDQIHTDIMLAPGSRWGWVDGMITNFHLPRSTLLAMLASMLEREGMGDGLERTHAIYAHAIHNRYRFYSYGDAMLVLP